MKMGRLPLLAFLALLTVRYARGERYALLIGAGDFPNAPGVSALAGPAYDVPALRAELIAHWGVKAGNVTVLLNDTASRTAILGELQRLANQASAGDEVVVYYSGHGTSANDPAAAKIGLGLSTGAILPADFKLSSDPRQMLSDLIIGTRDLRPVFERMDRNKVSVLVLFDSCYSGDSAKSIDDLTARNADVLAGLVATPETLTAFNNAMQTAGKNPEEWPYQNVVYISAASRYEKAWDISTALARTSRPTVDGNAHGAFTNALLEGLNGAADTNHDRVLSYSELHGFLVGELQKDGQTPQLHPRDSGVVRQPVLGSAAAPQMGGQGSSAAAGPSPTPEPASPPSVVRRPATPPSAPAPVVVPAAPPVTSLSLPPLRVRVPATETELAAALRRLPGVEVTNGVYDLAVTGRSPRLTLVHSGGSPLTFKPLRDQELIQTIANRARSHRLASMRFPAQDFNLELSMNPEQGAYYIGDRAEVKLRSEQAAWLMVFDIDIQGNVFLIYPNRREDAHAIRAGESVNAVEVSPADPLGTEILQAFAFAEKPAFYDSLVGNLQLSQTQVQDLTTALERTAMQPGRSQIHRVTVTSRR